MLVTAEESGAVWIDNLDYCSDAQVSGSLLVGDTWAQEWINMKWSNQHCLKQYQLEIKTRTCYQNRMSDVSTSWQRIMPHIHCAFAGTQFPQKSTKTASTNQRHLNSIALQHYLLKKTWNLPQSDLSNVFDKGIIWMLHSLFPPGMKMYVKMYVARWGWVAQLWFCCTWGVCHCSLQWLRSLTNQKITWFFLFAFPQRKNLETTGYAEWTSLYMSCDMWHESGTKNGGKSMSDNLVHSSDTVFCEAQVHCPQKNVTVTTFASCC